MKITDAEYTAEEIQEVGQDDEIVDTGVTAVALYDYQAAADDEISFDPEDIITHVEMVSLKPHIHFFVGSKHQRFIIEVDLK